jgi:mono/diheme cytochrome c family protein/glucose/arabinose dehydrogenase
LILGLAALALAGALSRWRQARGPSHSPPAPWSGPTVAEVSSREDASANDDDATALEPGLIAAYRSLITDRPIATVSAIDLKPAFAWGDSSPHPRMPPGPFAVEWSGYLAVNETDPIRLGAYVSGTLTVALDDVVVLSGRASGAGTWIEAAQPLAPVKDRYRIGINFSSEPGVPARVQLWWESRSFVREPIPATRFYHDPRRVPEDVRREATLSHGRDAARRFGCGRCHGSALVWMKESNPGPALWELGTRVSRDWLLDWLRDPAGYRPDARMPKLFGDDPVGHAERWLVGEYLLETRGPSKANPDARGDYRAGKQAFLGLGCIACHTNPEQPGDESSDPERVRLWHLHDRFTPATLAAFLQDPFVRYPDRRMPRFVMSPDAARDLAEYLLMWSSPTDRRSTSVQSDDAITSVLRRFGTTDRRTAAQAIIAEKGCGRCHPGMDSRAVGEVSLPSSPAEWSQDRGCLSKEGLPRFSIDAATRAALLAYAANAGAEKYPSEFAARQDLLRHYRCHRCHQRDSRRASPLEEIGRTLWSSFLARLPYQRTPRLTQATAKYRADYLTAAIRDGVADLFPEWYSYRMPAYGDVAPTIVQALRESDGDIELDADTPSGSDAALATMGRLLVGYEGYGCVSCHVWNGATYGEVEPGAVGPELASVPRRIRRAWFDRFLDNPLRVHPDTPMPAIFRTSERAAISAVLGGEADKHKDALWAYFEQGKKAASPKPRPPAVMPAPVPSDAPLVAHVPLRTPDIGVVESLGVWSSDHDFVLFDIGSMRLRNVYIGAQLLRHANTWRSFELVGAPLVTNAAQGAPSTFVIHGKKERPRSATFGGYDHDPTGVRLRYQFAAANAPVHVNERVSLERSGGKRYLVRRLECSGLPASASLDVDSLVASELGSDGMRIDRLAAQAGKITSIVEDRRQWLRLTGSPESKVDASIHYALPPVRQPQLPRGPIAAHKPDEGQIGPLERPGYRAVMFPRPKDEVGEDLVMPAALAVDPKTGRVFVASLKRGEIFVVKDPTTGTPSARFDPYVRGFMQDVFGMLYEEDSLVVLHRRNLTRVRDTDGDGRADRLERIAALDHAVADAYDWAYGLVRDGGSGYLFTLAPHANRHQVGAGSLVRLTPSAASTVQAEIAYGFRNPLGWCTGPDGEVFFTDNQGEWVAANKLCHVMAGRFYGFPNPQQPEHAQRPAAPTAIWVPYDWAKSINGVAFDASGGKFGPFAGQFFLAELMHGGAIVRASVEKVNGVYQGACFPFWGNGLLGPLVLTFDSAGRLYVGSVTTPGWMGQPDRGALFRLEFTGVVPFEMQSIRIRPNGFRITFTGPVERATAANPAAYSVNHYRYEYTGAYGSPELDRTAVSIRELSVSPDATSVDIDIGPPLRGRVYRIHAAGARSIDGRALTNPTGVYTVNEVPIAD